MNKKKLSIAATIVAIGAAGLVGGVAVPAFAAQSDCGPSQSCLWIGQNYMPTSTYFHSLKPQLDSFGAFNKKASSLYNRQAQTLWYYTGTNQTGNHLDVSVGGAYNSLRAVHFDKVLSSWIEH